MKNLYSFKYSKYDYEWAIHYKSDFSESKKNETKNVI